MLRYRVRNNEHKAIIDRLTKETTDMTTFEVAHLREQGQDMIIVPVNKYFGHKSNSEQNNIRSVIQRYARSAGLAGTVVPVWDAGFGRMGFLAPREWYPFFSSLTLADVAANINRKLICS
jgi:hypothetical protein